jgi:hypothetical protein
VEDQIMNRELLCVVGVCGGVSIALADVYVEVDFATGGPNGQTDGSLVIDGRELLSVYIWADEPGVLIDGINLDLNGESFAGMTGVGGAYRFESLGALDPEGAFAFPFSAGTISPSGTMLEGIVLANLFTQVTELPTSIDEALVIYAGFRGSAISSGDGVMPVADVVWALNFPVQTVHTYGVYQTPTPATLGVLGFGALMGSRRRRLS